MRRRNPSLVIGHLSLVIGSWSACRQVTNAKRRVTNNKKIRASLRKPGDQTYLRVPSIPSVAWQPYPSPLGRLRAHSFASPPHDGFAFVEDGQKHRLLCVSGSGMLHNTPVT